MKNTVIFIFKKIKQLLYIKIGRKNLQPGQSKYIFLSYNIYVYI